MLTHSLAKSIRMNHEEVLRRWLENLHGHIADDFEQMLLTPMGNGVATKLLGYAVDYLEAEDYQRNEVLHSVWSAAREASFRRAAVGYGLQDIVTTALAFRNALQETLLNNVTPSDSTEERKLLEGIMAINRIGDSMVSGEIAGYFSYQGFHEDQAGERESA